MKNQHFISSVEQRLNASNPAATSKNQRIYEFDIVSRDEHVLQLTSTRGRSIHSNLSMLDLFTFDVDRDSGTRFNFEQAFARYENQMRHYTERLLLAHSNRSREIQNELFGLFVAKIVNFIRNPYSVAKVVNTFGKFAQYHPTNPEIYGIYTRTLTGRRPHQEHLCRELGITDDQYSVWLRLLFMLLTPMADGVSNFLESAMKSLFESREQATLVHFHKYETHQCLLSDRGYSSPVPEHADRLVLDFNLCSTAFIRYAFLDYRPVLREPMPDAIRRGLERGPKMVQLSYLNNDLSALDVFHRRLIEQAFKRVYSSAATAYGTTVLPP